MNWKQHLIFSPELPTISKDAENLIRRFLNAHMSHPYHMVMYTMAPHAQYMAPRMTITHTLCSVHITYNSSIGSYVMRLIESEVI